MSDDLLSQHRYWYRLRWQMLWGLVAAAIPPLLRVMFVSHAEAEQGLVASANAFWGGLAAIVLGIVLIRNVGRYPGVERAAAIIPGFSASFGVLIVALLMLRLEYSRWGLAGAYVGAIVIFYIGYARFFGRRRLTIGILPVHGEVDRLRAIESVQWQTLNDVRDSIEGVDAIAVDLRRDLPIEWERRIADIALLGVPVYHSKHLVESLTGRVELEHLSETSYGTLSPPNTYMLPKHLLDGVTAAIALVLLSPLLLVVALLVRLDSPGPAIFRQRRIGFRGVPFVVFKFRTMRLEAPGQRDSRDRAITRQNDDRVTRLGRILRKSRVDELPQLLNVLKGQMSLIGPRPEAAVLSSWYEAEIPFYRYRHVVRPGITGWAQVMQGHVADVEEVRSKLYYDFYYIKNFSLWIDSLIVLRTLATMMTGFGAR
ncbi:sugar transferase [Sphingomonas yunnanensis]|uniref:sugar transferase n=1 Tax=Sphingomonas yunnanensis TaxID=310400 RepID=UPI001CA67015|nr:sugar transferase [Sphingomonas yunnanensis]MBY9063461.1 sugar transferase [Sphingomonas yunnanensis]